MIPLGMQDFDRVGVGGLVDGLAALPSLSRHLEHEIGARMRRANIHLDAFGMEGSSALDWLIDVCLKTFAPTEMTVWFRDQRTGAFCVAAFRPPRETEPPSSPVRLGEPLSHVVRHRSGVRFDPSSSDHSKAMLTPMILGSQVMGVVHVQAEDEFGEDDLQTFSLLTEVFTLGCFLAIHDGDAIREADRLDLTDGTRKAA